MSVFTDIRAAFEKQVQNISGVPSLLSWENVDFDPQAETEYLRLELVPLSSSPAVRGPNPTEEHRGVFSVGVFVPTNRGPNRADVLADATRDAFPASSFLTEGTTTVHLRSASRGQGVLINPFYFVPVEIRWVCFK